MAVSKCPIRALILIEVFALAIGLIGCRPPPGRQIPTIASDEVADEEQVAFRDNDGARLLSDAQGEALLNVDPTVHPFAPVLPRHVWKYTNEFKVVIHICVGRSGLVDRAEATQFDQPEIAQAAVRAIIGWRYKPLRIARIRTPFCYHHPMLLKRGSDPSATGQKFQTVTQ